ncbi:MULTISPECIES: HlyD family efflux transporter periplasmic adaptor subunit [Luteibacter]|uniref:HlyD family efflux transporter periplasmic adaptor subunit n=1 Tax=Luteibacter TaxID=242605 RepID=UPI000689790A|nr:MULTISPECIES: HlyD family efflux transporter periplasmic adaptor subunit [unclassified Luteibacter]
MLFRKEVFQSRQHRWLGSPRIVAPVPQRYAALAAVAFALGVLLWLCIGTYTRRVPAVGRLVPSKGLLSVSAQTPGTVVDVFVSVGQVVSKGSPLVVVSGERKSSALGNTSAGIVATLTADQSRLTADLDSAKELSASQAAALRLQLQTNADQLSRLDAQVDLQKSQIELQKTMLDKIAPLLDKGYVSALQVQQQKAQLLTSRTDLESLYRQRSDVVQQRNTASAQLAQLSMQLSEKLSDVGGRLSSSRQALAAAEVDRSTVLPAPGEGVVSSVLIKPGETAGPNQALVTIVPKGARLQAQLLVASEAVGFVRKGTPVMLRVRAFPFQKFGVVKGMVDQVSTSALSPEDAAMLLHQPQVQQEPMYLIDVNVPQQDIEAYGERRAMHAGMVVDADLLLDKRRIIEWIFEPLMGAKSRYGNDQ